MSAPAVIGTGENAQGKVGNDRPAADLQHLLNCFHAEHKIDMWEITQFCLDEFGLQDCSNRDNHTFNSTKSKDHAPQVTAYDLELLIKKWWMRHLKISERVVDFVSFNRCNTLCTDAMQRLGDYRGCLHCVERTRERGSTAYSPKLVFGQLISIPTEVQKCQCEPLTSTPPTDQSSAGPAFDLRTPAGVKRHWNALILQFLGSWLSTSHSLRADQAETIAHYVQFRTENTLRAVLAVLEPIVEHCVRIEEALERHRWGTGSHPDTTDSVFDATNLPPALAKAAGRSSFSASKLRSVLYRTLHPDQQTDGASSSSVVVNEQQSSIRAAPVTSPACAVLTDDISYAFASAYASTQVPISAKSRFGKRGPYKKRHSSVGSGDEAPEQEQEVVSDAPKSRFGPRGPYKKRSRVVTEAEEEARRAAADIDVVGLGLHGIHTATEEESDKQQQQPQGSPLDGRVTAAHVLYCFEALVEEQTVNDTGKGAEKPSKSGAKAEKPSKSGAKAVIIPSAEVLARVRRRLLSIGI